MMEARVGIEPTHKGFADLSLTTWVPRPWPCPVAENAHKNHKPSRWRGATAIKIMERETGVEPATSTLARSHSTTELLPLRGQRRLYRRENKGSNERDWVIE